MKKTIILLIAATALLTFSCNKYCNCKQYIDGQIDKDYKGGNFVNEMKDCSDYNVSHIEDGKTYEVKCK